MEGGRPVRRRLLAVVLVVLVVSAASLLVVDQRVRDREARALDACATHARLAVKEADSPLYAMTAYVRPVVDKGASAWLRHSMYALVSSVAAGAGGQLAPARSRCSDVGVWRWHHSLRDRREACIGALDAQAAFLRAVARDGHAVLHGSPSSVDDC